MMTIGIYFIEINDKFYIGQSVNIEKRLYEHKRLLKDSTHINYKLQEAYSKYPSTYNSGILHTCSTDTLNSLEAEYIDSFNTITLGYNIVAGGTCEARYGDRHPMSKHSNAEILHVAEMLAEAKLSQAEISRATGISRVTINTILKGTAHTWIKEKYPEVYNRITSVSDKDRYAIGVRSRPTVIKVKPFFLENKSLGIIEKVESISDFAKKYNIFSSKGNISSLKNGSRAVKSVKGWTLYTPVLEKDSI